MEFGRVTGKALENLALHLPDEPAGNHQVLDTSGKPFKAWLGTSKWGRKEWIGKIYPKGTKDANFLSEYVHHFNCIQLNATHYKIHHADEIAKWEAKAGKGEFIFCPKVTNSISHYSGFTGIEAITREFLDGIAAFGNKLGPVLLQVNEKFSPLQRDKLFHYLQSWPVAVPLFLEVRHPDWFADKIVYGELLSFLKAQKIGFALTDTAGRRDVLHMQLTIPKAFVRFAGNSLHPSDYKRIDEWAERLKIWIDSGLEELYFFIQMHDEALTPELCKYAAERFNQVCGLSLPVPQFL